MSLCPRWDCTAHMEWSAAIFRWLPALRSRSSNSVLWRSPAAYLAMVHAAPGRCMKHSNVAALWRLPLLLICDNNGYAVSTPVREALAVAALTDLAAPFGVPAQAVDATDVDQVAAAVSEAAARIRAGQGPGFLEMRCVRLATHS